MSSLRERLQEPELAGIAMDGDARVTAHRAILARKRMIRDVFVEFHRLFRARAERHFDARGIEVEIGAGVAPMRDSYAGVLATDVVFDRRLDCVVDAQRLPFRAEAVRAIYVQNAFHHFPDPERFFGELTRVLAPGGGAVLIAPYYGLLASALYPRLFRDEAFDKRVSDWRLAASGPMRGANQAQSYVVFVRDRARFERAFTELEVVEGRPLSSYLRYLASGGLNFRQLVPDWTIPGLRGVEWMLAPLRRVLALHHLIVLRKRR